MGTKCFYWQRMRSAVKKVSLSANKCRLTRSRWIRQLPWNYRHISLPLQFFRAPGALWKTLASFPKSQWLEMSWNGGAQRFTYFDAVVMEVRVGQELIGGVVHVRGQQLTHKVAVDVRLGRHVVGEAKQFIHAHIRADFHCVNEVRSDLCAVQVVEKITNKVGKSEVLAPLQVSGGQNFVFGEEVHRENTSKEQSLSHETCGHGRSLLSLLYAREPGSTRNFV